ncbi:hypothetical protein LSTR_LSTR004477 [Laodelphax striatellus]|uniref:G-protein coupled receptors family 1 profile domain-containing protein n=1 Tax=Laodelphax striatellus TaxID=195883 RepID=A0A482XMX4_LAOST|nr:hypothetical protein LSTR_LSTR004477 [Laodelphax striatellus]
MIGRGEVMNCYIVSLSVADLLCGLLVVPLSVYPALVEQWVYGDLVCRLVGYVQVTLWAVTVYTFMWISVDRYLAVRKPLRQFQSALEVRCPLFPVSPYSFRLMLRCLCLSALCVARRKVAYYKCS